MLRSKALGSAAAAALFAGSAAAAGAVPMHIVAPSHFAAPPTTAQCEASIGIACYSPLQFETAYATPALYAQGLNGSGKTIAIVDSFGSPTIRHDLAVFDHTYRLPAPPSLRIIQPAGMVPAFDPNNAAMASWAFETSLDVEYAHSIAPGANILLVETPVAETEGVHGFPQIDRAENHVIEHHLGDVISQSFGATEETFPSPQALYNLRSPYIAAAAANITVLAGSGDAGPTDYSNAAGTKFFPYQVNSWPSTDPLVTSVGGTQLHLDAHGNRTAPDNVWNDTALLGSPAASGGGTSVDFPRPSYQDSVASVTGIHRGTPDVSMTAAVNGGAIVYLSFPSTGVAKGFYIVGGTSEATPMFAGMVAIADQAAGHDLGLLNPKLYADGDGAGSGLTDITAGTNTVTFTQNGQTITVPGFPATPGYDLSSGLGTPMGPAFVAALGG